MTLKDARKLAEQAAESATLDADMGETVHLLAMSIAELAKSLDRRLEDLQREVKAAQEAARRAAR